MTVVRMVSCHVVGVRFALFGLCLRFRVVPCGAVSGMVLGVFLIGCCVGERWAGLWGRLLVFACGSLCAWWFPWLSSGCVSWSWGVLLAFSSCCFSLNPGILLFVALVFPCGIAWLLFLCGRDNRAMWCGAVGAVTDGVPRIGGTHLGWGLMGCPNSGGGGHSLMRGPGELLFAWRVAGGERWLATVGCALSLGAAHTPLVIRLCPGWGAAQA